MADVLSLMMRLEQSAPDRQKMSREEILREHVELLDHVHAPRRRSLRRVVELLDQALAAFEDLLPSLVGRGDVELAEDLQRATGCSLPRSIATELSVHVLSDGLTAIGDIFGDGIADIRPATAPAPIDPAPSRASRRWRNGDFDYRAYVAWCAGTEFDWEAATAALDSTDEPGREQLRTDLAEFREIVEGRYNRLVTKDSIDDLQLWMTAGTWRDGWTLVEPLRRLGEAGVLAAAGAVGWG
jgi:hypothetical protein